MRRFVGVSFGVLVVTCSALVTATANASSPAEDPTIEPRGTDVVIHAPQQVELRFLVDYVGQILDVRFFYADELDGKTVELRPSPVVVPRSHVLSLLVNLLRVRGLALIEEQPGLYRIAKSESALSRTTEVVPIGVPIDEGSYRVITQVLRVSPERVPRISERLSAVLSAGKSSVIAIPEDGLLIVTDYAARLAVLHDLIAALDVDAPAAVMERIATHGHPPAAVAEQVRAVLTEVNGRPRDAIGGVVVRGDVLPHELLVIGSPSDIAQVRELVVHLLPVRVDGVTRAYAPRYLTPARLATLIDETLFASDGPLSRPSRVYVDEPGGRLFVTAEEATHTAVAELLERDDLPQAIADRPLRIYRPKHRRAAELLATIGQLLGTDGGPAAPQTPHVPARSTRPADDAAAPSVAQRVHGADYVLTEDPHTNAIVAIATRPVHAQLETLIERLDRARPQVVIEMTLVAVTMTDSFDLGIELKNINIDGGWDYLLFSSFGLSTIDVGSGLQTPTPGVGGNAILIRPERFTAILRALSTSGHAKVISTPRLLVSDNAQGTLRNVDEAPFTSVNASDTVATTSFAGFESAGTTLSVTPHIMEGDTLTLEYDLSFSNFSGSAANGSVPPPRTTNSFSSVVEVPDGHVIATGGLIVENTGNSTSRVPGLGDIPVVGNIFGAQSRQQATTRVFAFIRPVIVREDRLWKLRNITLEDLDRAELEFDPSVAERMQWMR